MADVIIGLVLLVSGVSGAELVRATCMRRLTTPVNAPQSQAVSS